MSKLPQIVLTSCLIYSSLLTASPPAPSQPLTAIDIAGLFAQGSIDANEILRQSINSHLRIEPEYLGIAFYNTETQERVDPEVLRELTGHMNQDGITQLIDTAMRTSNRTLPFNQEQLLQLLNAAFIASMVKPEPISIEFYDTRVGPTGQGGGVSGRTPTETTPFIEQVKPTQTAKPAETFDPYSAHQRFELLQRVLPKTEQALLEMLKELEINAKPRPGLIVLPVIVAAPDLSSLEVAYQAERMVFITAFQLDEVEVIREQVDQPTDELYRKIVVSYFSGNAEEIMQLEQDLQGVFYR